MNKVRFNDGEIGISISCPTCGAWQEWAYTAQGLLRRVEKDCACHVTHDDRERLRARGRQARGEGLAAVDK